MEEKVITVPSTSEEMTLRQLIALLEGDVKTLLGMSDEEIETADLDDLVKAMDAWQKVELKPSVPFDTIVGYGNRFMINPMLQEFTVAEQLILETASQNPLNNLHILIAIHMRPAVGRGQGLLQMKRSGASFKKLMRVARTGQKWFAVPFDKDRMYESAELFLDTMTAAQAIYISSYFAILAKKLLETV